MSEYTIPSLTLTPEEDAAQAVQAPAAPTLTTNAEPAAAPKKEAEPVVVDDSMLSEAEKKAVNEFVEKIDITDATQVMQYGVAAQKNIAAFSENALNQVRTKDLGDIGDSLSSLVVELKNYDPSGEPQKKKGLFGRAKVKADEVRAQNAKAEANVDKICEILEQHKLNLMKDVAMLDQMYDLNQQYYKELTMYIVAGKKKLAKVKAEDLQQLHEKAVQSGTQEDAEAYNDYANMVQRFEKKIGDLELTRMISLQMGPQTRLLQNNDAAMIEKIDTSLLNTIPLWKSQMVISMGLERSRQATAAQSAVTNMTNELLKKNSEMLKMGTINTARESERGIVDLETLRKTNEDLISTLDEVMKIQDEGRQKRADAEKELGKIEGELRQKLLELRA